MLSTVYEEFFYQNYNRFHNNMQESKRGSLFFIHIIAILQKKIKLFRQF